MVNFNYIQTPEDLEKAAKIWRRESLLAIDLECENNLHHYGTYITIIQISSKTEHWIVDILKLKKIEPLIKVLENKKIEKIFHDVGFDFRVLNHQFSCRPKNVFDTQFASLLAGKTEIGLGSLLQEYLGIRKISRFQMADWTQRPLSQDMLDYAINDTRYLINLRDFLSDELKELGRTEWAKEEFKIIEEKKLTYKEGGYRDVKGYSTMEPHERAILKRLFKLREKLAKKVDRPVHFIIGTKHLVTIAQNPPKTVLEWRKLKRVHPVVKNYANIFLTEVQLGKKEKISVSIKEKKKYSKDQKKRINEFSELRDELSKELGLQRHIILSKDQIQTLVLTKKTDCLRQWQKDLLKL